MSSNLHPVFAQALAPFIQPLTEAQPAPQPAQQEPTKRDYDIGFGVKREAIEICKQFGCADAAHAIQGLLAVNVHVEAVYGIKEPSHDTTDGRSNADG